MNARKLAATVVVVVALSNNIHAAPLGTAFTYQGQLQSAGAPATGSYDFQFTLYDAASGGSAVTAVLSTNGVGVNDGLFTVSLDFGSSVFAGEARWLSVAVRTNGAPSYNLLSPRQPVTASAYALFAPNAGVAASATAAGTANAVGANAVTAAGIAAGQVVKSLNGLHDAVTLNQGANVTLSAVGQSLTLSSPTDWHIGGNAGITPGADFLGTVNDEPLELRVNNNPVLRLQHSGDGFNVIGGSPANSVAAGVVGATISGGGNTNGSVLNYTPNSIAANYSFIGGGGGNQVGGGAFNSVIGGGGGNQTGGSGYDSVIGGGFYNAVTGPYSTVPGGLYNTAAGGWSLAAGIRAQANHNGTFVWADYRGASGPSFASTGTNQFLVRASGGLQVFDGSIFADSGGANTNGTLNPAPGLVFGGTGSGEGMASKRLNDGTGNTWGLDFFTDFLPRLSINNGGDLWIYDHTLFLRSAFDENHGLGWFGLTKTFATNAVDGPVLFGYSGGALGTEQFGAENIALYWNALGKVGIGTTAPAQELHVVNPASASNGAGVMGENLAAGGAGVYGVSRSTTGTGVAAQGASTSSAALTINTGGIRVAGAGVGTPTAAFIHVASAANSGANWTHVDNPLCNSDPNAILIVTTRFSSSFYNHVVGVWYDAGYAKWQIFNQDNQAVPVGSAFNVLVIKN